VKHLLFVCRYFEPVGSYALPYGNLSGNLGPKPTILPMKKGTVEKHVAIWLATVWSAAKLVIV